jgi:hypothetical protein
MSVERYEPGSETSHTGAPPPAPKRINVAVNADMVAALQNVIQHEGVSLTEAVRRLVNYGDFVYRTARQDNADILVRSKDGETKQVLLV